MSGLIHKPVLHFTKSKAISVERPIVAEEPLSIRIQGNPYSVVMRTPGEEKAHVAGFCLAEGIVDHINEIVTIGFCDPEDTNVVTVTLTEKRRREIPNFLERRGFISQTSCGICGKELIEDLEQKIMPLEPQAPLAIGEVLRALSHLPDYQPLRQETRACHGAMLCDSAYQTLSVAEDVGRHNALDKAIGKLFLDKRLDQAALLVLSSRISYEMVQKAARAGIAVVIAVSYPTALAVALATRLNMTLMAFDKKEGVYIYCGHDGVY